MSFIPPALLQDLSRLSSQGPRPGPRKASTRAKAFVPKTDALPDAVLASSSVDVSAPPPPAPAPNQKPPKKHHGKEAAHVLLRPTTGTAPPPDNAFKHPTTAKRVAHLAPSKQASTVPQDLTFIYDVTDRPNPGVNTAPPRVAVDAIAGHHQGAGGGEGRGDHEAAAGETDVELSAEDMQVVKAVVANHQQVYWRAGGCNHGFLDVDFLPETDSVHLHQEGSSTGEDGQGHYPSLRPTTRKEVALLKHTMVALIKEIGADMDQEYPTEMHAFLALIKEEQKIYDAVFAEIIRQVTVNMIERGEVLAEIRTRYANMFSKIPQHVKHLHTELVAQRKLNRRLSEELLRSKETTQTLIRELEVVRKHDTEVSKQASDAQEKLISVLTQSDGTDEILEEYHKLYRMQRDRLEEAVRLTEQEKRMWVDAATSLALRIGQEHGITDLVQLQKFEHARLRAANHMIVIISNTNDSELTAIERKIEEWRAKLIRLSQSVVEEDQQNIETVAKMQRDMQMVLKSLSANEPTDTIEAEHPALKVFHLYDVRSLADHLMKWVEQITSVAIRFTSDRDLTIQEEISQIRKMGEVWIEAGHKLLRRNERNTNGRDYVPLTDMVTNIGIEVDEWLTKLDMRVSGEDGIASHVISLQNQLEDRYTTYSARDFDKPLPPSERTQLRESLTTWIDHIGTNIIDTLSNTTEKEQHKVPLHVENWAARLLDQMNTDTDIRNEENLKLHTAMISWMVHLLVKGGKEAPSDAWDHEFHQLQQELLSFNVNLMRDASDIEMLSDDKKNLRTVV
ncbi:Axonemal dynein light chain domain-containing protein 1, partial [Borealophlyctis nickersoniae]